MVHAPAPALRDPRIDLFRGLALLAIFINHIPGNPARFLTWTWLGFSDAAELFMLLAGLSLALGYGRLYRRHGQMALTMRLARRAWHLYRAYLLLALMLATVGALAFAATGDRAILWHLGIEPLMDNTIAALPALFSLRYLPGYADILATYVPLVLISAVLLPIALRRPLLVLIPSAVLWLFVQLSGANLSAGFQGEAWMFNPLAWQLLFCIGLLIGVGKLQNMTWPRHPAITLVAVIWLVIGLIAASPWRNLGLWEGAGLVASKEALGWTRLLHILALTHMVVILIPPTAAWLCRPLLRPLSLLGRQALPVFAAGAVLSFVGHYLFTTLTVPSALVFVLVNAGGVGLLLLLAGLLEWQAAAPWADRSPSQVDPRRTDLPPVVPSPHSLSW